MSGCTAPVYGHRSSTAAEKCPVCRDRSSYPPSHPYSPLLASQLAGLNVLGPNVAKMLAPQFAGLNVLGPNVAKMLAPQLAGLNVLGPNVAKMLAPQFAGLNVLGPNVAKMLTSQLAGFNAVGPNVAKALGRQFPGLSPSTWLALKESLEAARNRRLPPNLSGLANLDVEALRTLADEGITLWAVPRREIAAALIAAPDTAARRRVIGVRWMAILDDCAGVATMATSGPFGVHAHFLEQAINAIKDGHVAAGQSLAASTLDSILQVAMEKAARVRLTNHRNPAVRMDHFRELKLQAAMVFRPIWHAYRPQDTPAQRALASTFARHGVAHNVSGRQFNRRNAVQGAMLAASLLNYMALWREGR